MADSRRTKSASVMAELLPEHLFSITVTSSHEQRQGLSFLSGLLVIQFSRKKGVNLFNCLFGCAVIKQIRPDLFAFHVISNLSLIHI